MYRTNDMFEIQIQDTQIYSQNIDLTSIFSMDSASFKVNIITENELFAEDQNKYLYLKIIRTNKNTIFSYDQDTTNLNHYINYNSTTYTIEIQNEEVMLGSNVIEKQAFIDQNIPFVLKPSFFVSRYETGNEFTADNLTVSVLQEQQNNTIKFTNSQDANMYGIDGFKYMLNTEYLQKINGVYTDQYSGDYTTKYYQTKNNDNLSQHILKNTDVKNYIIFPKQGTKVDYESVQTQNINNYSFPVFTNFTNRNNGNPLFYKQSFSFTQNQRLKTSDINFLKDQGIILIDFEGQEIDKQEYDFELEQNLKLNRTELTYTLYTNNVEKGQIQVCNFISQKKSYYLDLLPVQYQNKTTQFNIPQGYENGYVQENKIINGIEILGKDISDKLQIVQTDFNGNNFYDHSINLLQDNSFVVNTKAYKIGKNTYTTFYKGITNVNVQNLKGYNPHNGILKVENDNYEIDVELTIDVSKYNQQPVKYNDGSNNFDLFDQRFILENHFEPCSNFINIQFNNNEILEYLDNNVVVYNDPQYTVPTQKNIIENIETNINKFQNEQANTKEIWYLNTNGYISKTPNNEQLSFMVKQLNVNQFENIPIYEFYETNYNAEQDTDYNNQIENLKDFFDIEKPII